MVVRVVQTEQPSAVQCESSEPGVSNDLNLDVTAMSSSADWTDLGTGLQHGLDGLFTPRDSGLEESFDPFHGRGLPETDVYNESVSAEPSLGRSSEVGFNRS